MLKYLLRQRLINISALMMLSVLFTTIAHAQQQKNDVPASDQQESTSHDQRPYEPQQKQSSSTLPSVAEQKNKNDRAPDPVFRPSEEISEDSPVPFPVDI